MRTKLLLCALLLCVMTGLTGCGNKIQDEETIANDVVSMFNDIAQVGEILESYTIVERNTDIENQLDTILCEIISSDGLVEYMTYYTLQYIMEEEGWSVESFEPENEYAWTAVPLVGVENIDIREYITERNWVIDGLEWNKESISLGNVKEISRNTQLEQKVDTITLDVELLSPVLVAKGEIKVNYVFNGGWSIDRIDIVKEFTSVYQDGKEFDMTEDAMITALENNPSSLGSNARETFQNVDIVRNEITDFIMEDVVISNAGTVQECECSFGLNKAVANFDMRASVRYEYDEFSGWKVAGVEYSKCDVTGLNLDVLKGQWNGQLEELEISNDMQQAIMEIVQVSNEEGTFEATISVPTEKRKCSVKGYVNFTDLTMTVSFVEWIERPKKNASLYEPELYGIIVVNDASLKNAFLIEANEFEFKKIK